MPDRDRGKCLIWLTVFLWPLAPLLLIQMDKGHLLGEDSSILPKTDLDKLQGN